MIKRNKPTITKTKTSQQFSITQKYGYTKDISGDDDTFEPDFVNMPTNAKEKNAYAQLLFNNGRRPHALHIDHRHL